MLSRPPAPTDSDARRWTHTALRYALLKGDWEDDLRDWMALHLDAERLSAWGAPDLASNALKQSCQLRALTYRVAPSVHHSDPTAGPFLAARGPLTRSRLWIRQRWYQYLALGLRELALVPYLDRVGSLRVRAALPHNLVIEAEDDAPDEPVVLRELRVRGYNGHAVYVWNIWDLSDPATPAFYTEIAASETASEVGLDLTSEIYESPPRGESYPWRYRDGRPYIPHTLYHAQETGEVWDPWGDREVVRGALTAAMLHTYAIKCARDATGKTVLTTNCNLAGLLRQAGADGKIKVANLEPGTLLDLPPQAPDKPQTITEVGPGAQLQEVYNFAVEYEKRILYRAGIKPPDPTAQHGDPRSGYALALDDRQRRELVNELADLQRPADEALLGKMAALLNQGYPEADYDILYPAIPLTVEEERERREKLTWELKMGVKETWEVLREYLPGLSETEAKARAARLSLDSLMEFANGAAGRSGRAGAA